MKSKTDPHLDFAKPGDYELGQLVDLVIKQETDLGYKAIINGTHWGVLYANEVFQELNPDQQISGYIKKVREDGRIDLTLYKTGHRAAEDVTPQLIDALVQAGGFLPLNDKTSPQTIYREFGVSKKKFKIVVSGLYKKRLITIEEGGIRLIPRKSR